MNAFEELPTITFRGLTSARKPPILRISKAREIAARSCHRQLDERRQDRDRAQQLDELHERRAVANYFDIEPKNGYRMLMDGIPG